MGFIGSNTVALVTGGSRGLGLAAARGIGRRGARVIVLGRENSRVTAAAAELVDDGVDGFHNPEDQGGSGGASGTRSPAGSYQHFDESDL